MVRRAAFRVSWTGYNWSSPAVTEARLSSLEAVDLTTLTILECKQWC